MGCPVRKLDRYNNKQFRYLQYFLYLGIAFLNELNAIPNVDGVADGVKSFQGFMDGVVSRFQVNIFREVFWRTEKMGAMTL